MITVYVFLFIAALPPQQSRVALVWTVLPSTHIQAVSLRSTFRLWILTDSRNLDSNYGRIPAYSLHCVSQPTILPAVKCV